MEDPWCRERAKDQCLSHAMVLEAAKEAEDADMVTALFDAERWILSVAQLQPSYWLSLKTILRE